MSSKGFQALSLQQIYQKSGIYPEDARSIAQALDLGNEPFRPLDVEKITQFAKQAREAGLTLKQAIAQVSPVQSDESTGSACKCFASGSFAIVTDPIRRPCATGT